MLTQKAVCMWHELRCSMCASGAYQGYLKGMGYKMLFALCIWSYKCSACMVSVSRSAEIFSL